MSTLGSSIVILKFGSSVLHSVGSLPIAVAEIYRHYREGKQVVAVVSAFEGVTDNLLIDAGQTEDADGTALATLLSTGEIASAAHLTLALHRAGIPSRVVDPRDIGLTAAGSRTNAELVGVETARLKVILSDVPVAVVPGFFAQSGKGGVALLGRGGSDLTALYLAAELKAACVLLKDVDGLYETDPATASEAPRRYHQADYATAEAHAGSLVQPKAVSFARASTLCLDVARVGSSARTRIGEGPSIWASTTSVQRIRIALLGLGTVGGGVYEYLAQFPERFELAAVLVQDLRKFRERELPAGLLVGTLQEVFVRAPEIVVEALPGIDPARGALELALKGGIRVVSANKALLAAHWEALAPKLAGPRRPIRYAAAVGGGVPMLEFVERLKLRMPISELRGVINGTCNYVLDRCAGGVSLAVAVRRAQDLGLAERDPSSDLSGLDAARKMEILGRVAFGGLPICHFVSGISESTCRPKDGDPQKRVALIAEARRTEGGFSFKVSPHNLNCDEFLAGTRGAENRLEITMRDGSLVRLRGEGAGRVPTATSMFADVLEHARVIDAERGMVDPSVGRNVPTEPDEAFPKKSATRIPA
jgi:homoserine dehydrogenase